MAMLYITECRNLGFDPSGGSIMVPHMPAEAEQAVPIGGVSQMSAPFASTTRYLMVHPDVACCLAWGPGAVAVTGFHRVGPGETRFYSVNPGARVAVITSA